MKKKNLIWWILLIIGFIPFILPIFFGIKSAIFGYSGLCLFDCSLDYGFSAFIDSIIILSYLFWPAYLIGIILIIIGIFKLIENKKLNKYKDLL